MASNQIAMASPSSDGLQPNSDGLQPESMKGRRFCHTRPMENDVNDVHLGRQRPTWNRAGHGPDWKTMFRIPTQWFSGSMWVSSRAKTMLNNRWFHARMDKPFVFFFFPCVTLHHRITLLHPDVESRDTKHVGQDSLHSSSACV